VQQLSLLVPGRVASVVKRRRSQTAITFRCFESIGSDFRLNPIFHCYRSQLHYSDRISPGADDAILYNGALTLSSASVASSGTAKQFDILINLSQPFLYNPANGNLLLDIRNNQSGTSGLFDAQSDVTQTATALVFNDGGSASTTGLVQAGGGVTRFTLTAAPEPSTFVLFSFGIAEAALGRIRKA